MTTMVVGLVEGNMIMIKYLKQGLIIVLRLLAFIAAFFGTIYAAVMIVEWAMISLLHTAILFVSAVVICAFVAWITDESRHNTDCNWCVNTQPQINPDTAIDH